MSPITVNVDVTGSVPLDGSHHVSAWVFVPASRADRAADDLTITDIPGVCGLLSVVPFIASDHAGRVTCPVFIGLGARDSTPDHHNEPRAYYSSHDITLYLLAKSAHCHNRRTPGTSCGIASPDGSRRWTRSERCRSWSPNDRVRSSSE